MNKYWEEKDKFCTSCKEFSPHNFIGLEHVYGLGVVKLYRCRKCDKINKFKEGKNE